MYSNSTNHHGYGINKQQLLKRVTLGISDLPNQGHSRPTEGKDFNDYLLTMTWKMDSPYGGAITGYPWLGATMQQRHVNRYSRIDDFPTYSSWEPTITLTTGGGDDNLVLMIIW